MTSAVLLRAAEAADAPFLREMLVEAAFWRPDGPRGSVPEVMASATLARYIAGWPMPGDTGVVAVDGELPVGAAWLRLLPASDPGYGFVDPATPELCIGVRTGHRGRGVGARLLRAVIGAAREHGLAAVSLSVEVENPAVRLYERAGFRMVGVADGSQTMRLQL